MKLNNLTAVVTGGGRGIGRAIALRFAAEGANVVIADFNASSAYDTAYEIKSSGGFSLACATDVADASSIQSMVEETHASFGQVSILINNAGIAVFDTPTALSMDDWRRCMAVDLDGAWLCAKAVLPDMIASRKGSIVNIASVHSFQVLKGAFPYGVAKHGVIGLTRALAIEYASMGIRSNAICPGYIDTPINTELGVDMDKAGALHPPGRVGRPEEVAAATLFLASDEASFINGASLMVDGGRSLLYHD